MDILQFFSRHSFLTFLLFVSLQEHQQKNRLLRKLPASFLGVRNCCFFIISFVLGSSATAAAGGAGGTTIFGAANIALVIALRMFSISTFNLAFSISRLKRTFSYSSTSSPEFVVISKLCRPSSNIFWVVSCSAASIVIIFW